MGYKFTTSLALRILAACVCITLAHCYAAPNVSSSQINHDGNNVVNQPTAGGGGGPSGLTVKPSADGGKCLQVQSAAGGASGLVAGVGTCNGSTAQRWAYDNGQLQNVGARQCLDVGESAAINANTALTVQPCSAARPGQAWIVDHGLLYLSNNNNPLSLGLSVTPPVEDTTVVLTKVDFNSNAQQWMLDVTVPGGTGQVTSGFAISPTQTATACLDLDGNILVTNPCSAANSQHWTWLVTGQLQSSSNSNDCLDLPSNANTVGMQPTMMPCNPNVPTQEWVSTGGQFVNNALSQCVDANGVGAAHAPVQLTTCSGGPSQQWEWGTTP